MKFATSDLNVSDAAWYALVKRTIARFARGNISAQRERILLPEEQEKLHAQARVISRAWKARPNSPIL
tara:strand:+ start:486 stop:689 length:204 start_codon:yes stop_codon:yes gene_type:complete